MGNGNNNNSNEVSYLPCILIMGPMCRMARLLQEAFLEHICLTASVSPLLAHHPIVVKPRPFFLQSIFCVDGQLPSSEERTHLSETQFPNLPVREAISLCREAWRQQGCVGWILTLSEPSEEAFTPGCLCLYGPRALGRCVLFPGSVPKSVRDLFASSLCLL